MGSSSRRRRLRPGPVAAGPGRGRARLRPGFSQPGPAGAVAAGPGWRCTAPRVTEIGRVPRRDRFGSAPRSVPASSLSAAGPKTTEQPSNGPDAGRVFTVWDRRGSARRRPGARPRDSKDRSKALRPAPTRLPRIVNPHPALRTPPPADRRPSTDARRLAAQTQIAHQQAAPSRKFKHGILPDPKMRMREKQPNTP